jgi:hypothetical protein
MPIEIVEIGPPTTVAGGKSVYEEYWFGDEQDVGPCYSSVSSNPPFKGRLTQGQQGRVGYQKLSPGGVWIPNATAWHYTVTTTNTEAYATAYNLQIAILKNG